MSAAEEGLSVRMTENTGKRKMRKNQYIATLLVSILSFSQGSFMGWATPVLPRLQSRDTPARFPPIGEEDASWIGSVSSLTSVLAIPLYSYSIDKLGRKYTGYIMAVPFIISWVMTILADSVSVLIAARCLGGLSLGGVGVLVPTYANDVAEDDIRGLLGTIHSSSLSLGMLYANAAGFNLSYTWFNITCLLQPVAFLLCFFWLPESPLFLLTRGKEQEAKKSLTWLRDGRDSDIEFLRVKKRAEDFAETRINKISLSDIMNRSTWRALLICLGVITNFLLTGYSPVTIYAVTIFQSSGSSFSAETSALILSALYASASILSSYVVEKIGRKLLLISTNILISASLFVLGVFFYMNNIGTDIEAIQWLPVTCISVYILCVGLAVIPITFLLTTELPSAQARGPVQSIAVIYLSVGMFVTAKTFTNLSYSIGTDGCFWLYGSSCVLSAIIIYLTLPETKGRSSEDIIAQLNSDQYISSVIHGQRIKVAE